MIESIILKDNANGKEIKINKFDGPYWLEEIDLGVVNSTNHTFKYINQIGETLYNKTIDTRDISITGWIGSEDRSVFEKLKKEMNVYLNPLHSYDIILGSNNQYKLTMYPSTSIKYSTTYNENNEILTKFLISGYCPYPMFTKVGGDGDSIAYTEKRFVFPWIIPKEDKFIFGVRNPSLITEVKNDGIFDVGFRVEFSALGVVKNPMILDVETQEFIKINKTLQTGEKIIVNTTEGSRKVIGVLNGIESNYFKYRDFDSSWLALRPGSTFLKSNAEEGKDLMEVFISFDPCYMEVDL